MKEHIIRILLVLGFVGCNTVLYSKSVLMVTCEAFYTYEAYDGPLPVNGGITFSNQATGDYENISWDFGDGNFSSEASSAFDYFYVEEGIYNVCMTVWNDVGCVNTFCADVVVGDLNNICDLTECVFPGDADKDGEANFYDLLSIGIGHGVTGPTRPNATTEWIGQQAPDWAEVTPDGVNYKHLDCDGNGIINNDDALAITENYVVMDQPNPTAEDNAPLIHIEFESDTIYVDPNSNENIEVIAHLKVGTSNFPAQDVYGLALYLSYPEDLMFEDSVFFNYNENAFFGAASDVLWVPNNQYDEAQIDIGLTRKDGSTVGGHGEIGDGIFVINDDILDGRIANGDVYFPLSINGVKLVDESGEELSINLTTIPASVVFRALPETTSTHSPEIAEKISLFPNPVKEKLYLNFSDLDGKHYRIFNNFGQTLMESQIANSNLEVNVKGWENGVYFIQIQTDQGLATKRFIIN